MAWGSLARRLNHCGWPCKSPSCVVLRPISLANYWKNWDAFLKRYQSIVERRCFAFHQPARELKLRALAAAADLAERSRLIDSARRYVGLLVELDSDNTT